jgi:hypothetical protein
MPRPRKDLDSHKSQIIQWFLTDNLTSFEIASRLSELGVSCDIRTIQRRLARWNVQKRTRTIDTPQLRLRIVALFFESMLSDQEMLKALHIEGHQIELVALVRLRKELGCMRKKTEHEQIEAEKRFRDIIQKELDTGVIEGYGRRLLYTHFRTKGHLISRLVVLQKYKNSY